MSIEEKVLGTIAVVKFHANPMNKGNNPLITRTFKRIGVISSKYKDESPNDGEFWVVKIVSQKNKGVIVVKPIQKIDINKVVLNFDYDHEIQDGILFVYPKINEYCMLLSKEKKHFDSESITTSIVRLNHLELVKEMVV